MKAAIYILIIMGLTFSLAHLASNAQQAPKQVPAAVAPKVDITRYPHCHQGKDNFFAPDTVEMCQENIVPCEPDFHDGAVCFKSRPASATQNPR
jgi:hypothetical protein